MNKAERTRQYIIEKTAPIFNVKGYSGTSLNDMMRATGLTKGSIYGNFANKDEVALEAFNCNLKKLHSLVQQSIRDEKTYRNKLLVFAKVYQNFLNRPFPEGGCPILNTAIEADDTHDLLRQKAKKAIIEWKNQIMELVANGIVAGEFKSKIDPEGFAITMIALIEGAIMITKLTGNTQFKKKIVRSIEQMVDSIKK